MAQANTEYGKSAPVFDEVLMLRVAMAYNLSRTAADLSFPAKSRRACEIAAIGALTFVNADHAGWVFAGEDDELEASLEAATGKFRACGWMLSDAGNAALPGVRRVWKSATMKRNFKKLREALRRADCRAVDKALGRYPKADLSRAKLDHKIEVVMTRPCQG